MAGNDEAAADPKRSGPSCNKKGAHGKAPLCEPQSLLI
jgi:hypothetical protein